MLSHFFASQQGVRLGFSNRSVKTLFWITLLMRFFTWTAADSSCWLNCFSDSSARLRHKIRHMPSMNSVNCLTSSSW